MLMYGKYEGFIMQMLYVCDHPVAVLNAAFGNLLVLVEEAKGSKRHSSGAVTAVWQVAVLIVPTHPAIRNANHR